MSFAHADSESGVGTAFEYRVGCYLYAMLASSGSMPYANGYVVEVAFQVSHTGAPVDDQRVVIRNGTQTNRYFQQCKVSLKAQSSNKTFQEVLAAIYRGVRGDWKDADDNDYHVIVTDRISVKHEQSLKRLFSLAETSVSLADLSEKLSSESGDVRSMLDTVLAALQKGIQLDKKSEAKTSGQIVDPQSLLRLLQQTRLWKSDLHDEFSRDWHWAIEKLTPFVKQDVSKAKNLMARFEADMRLEENRRATRNFDTLRRKYGDFDRPRPIDEGATFLSKQHLENLESQVRNELQRLRNGFVYEATEALERLIYNQEKMVIDRVSVAGPSLDRLCSILAEALRVVGIGMTNMSFEAEALNKWIVQARKYASSSTRLWAQIARVAAFLSDSSLFNEAIQHVEFGQEYGFLRAQKFALDNKLDEALREAKGIEGEFRVEALAASIQWLTQKALADPFALFQAFDCAKELRQLQPERPIIRLLWAQTVQQMLSPTLSCFYSNALGDNQHKFGQFIDHPARFVDEASAEIQAVLESEIGSFELAIAVQLRIETEILAMRTPLINEEWISSCPPFIFRCQPLSRLRYAHIALRTNRIELAKNIITSIDSSKLNEGEKSEVDRYARSLNSDEFSLEALLPDFEDATPQSTASLRRQGVYVAFSNSRLHAWKVLKDMELCDSEYAFVSECHALLQYADGNYEEAEKSIEQLIKLFPNAYDCYVRLGIYLSQWYLERFSEFRIQVHEEDSSTRRTADISEQGNVAREAAMKVLRHAGEQLGSKVALDRLIQLATSPLNSKELAYAAVLCRDASYSYGYNISLALAAFVDYRNEDAIEAFEAAELDRELNSYLRFAFDQCRMEAGNFDDLISNAEELLCREDRLPVSVIPTVNAMLHEGQRVRAFEVAKRNFKQFEDNADAMALYWRTAMQAGRKAECAQAMMDFHHRFKEDRRVQQIEITDPTDVLKPIQDFERYIDERQSLYESCRVPLLVLGNNYLDSWHKQIHNAAGLQTQRLYSCGQVGSSSDLSRTIVMDYSAVLAASRYRLWTFLREKGLRLVIHPATRQALRNDLFALKVDHPEREYEEAMAIELFLRGARFKKIVSVDPENAKELGDCPSYLRLDQAVAKSRNAVIVNSYRQDEDDEVPLFSVLEAAYKSGRIDGLTLERYQEALEPHLIDRTSDCQTLQAFPDRILISAPDVIALSECGFGDEIVALFDEVYAGPGTLFMLGLQHGNATHVHQTLQEGQRAWDCLESALRDGVVSELPASTRPRISSTDYLKAIRDVSYTEEAMLWTDEVCVRFLLGFEGSGSVSCCTSDICHWLQKDGVLSSEEDEDRRLAMALDGHRDLAWCDLLELAYRKDPTRIKLERVAWRLSTLLRPEASRSLEEQGHYAMLVVSNIVYLASKLDCDDLRLLDKPIEMAAKACKNGSEFFFLGLIASAADLPGDHIWPWIRALALKFEREGQFRVSSFNELCRRRSRFDYSHIASKIWMRYTFVEFMYWWHLRRFMKKFGA